MQVHRWDAEYERIAGPLNLRQYNSCRSDFNKVILSVGLKQGTPNESHHLVDWGDAIHLHGLPQMVFLNRRH